MAKSLTDWSALNRLKVPVSARPSPPPPVKPTPADAAAAEVINYFSRKSAPNVVGKGGKKTPDAAVPSPAPTDDAKRLAELQATMAAMTSRLASAEAKAVQAEARAMAARAEKAQAERELLQCRRKCVELQAVIDRAAGVAEPPMPKPIVESSAPMIKGLLKAPPDLAEAFPGEVRELILAALAEAALAAQNGGRERRSAVLATVLAANPASKELEKRRAQLKQILKDSGYNPNPAELKKLGFRLISGRHHWKLEYAGLRMTLAKTPSDYRANLNSAAEFINRCF